MTTATAPKSAQRGNSGRQSADHRRAAASTRGSTAGKARAVGKAHTADRPHAADKAHAADNAHATAPERAAAKVLDQHTLQVTLPDGIGTLRLPEPKRLAFYGGLTVLAALGIVEWPVAVVLGVGHLLAEDHHHKVLAEFGEALGEA